jgi:hypothetical protein
MGAWLSPFRQLIRTSLNFLDSGVQQI